MRLTSRLPALAAALALPQLALATSIVRGPFLQQTTPTSTIVVVSTDAAAHVEAVADLPGGGTAQAKSDGTHHLLRLSGLPAAATIPFHVTLDGAPAGDGSVRTPAVPGTEAARHAVIGATADTGSAGPNARANVARMELRGVEAVLTMGDNSYPDGAAGEWDTTFFGVWKDLMRSATMWTGVGDHEYRTPFAQPYLDSVELPQGPQGERYYSFDWGDLHVAALDTNCIVPMDASQMGCDTATMVAWLEADLAASKAPWKLVTMHRPALATGKYGVFPEIPRALLGPFEKYGVDLVLQAHNHLYERTWPARQGAVVKKDYDHPGAPVYLTAGGGSDYLYESVLPAAEWTAFRATEYQHLILTLDGGTLLVESVRPDGSLLDKFQIVKDVPPPSADPLTPPAPGDTTTPPPVPEQSVAGPKGAGGGGGCGSGPGGALALGIVGAVLAWTRRGARARRP
ncbi:MULTISPECIES: metallophosphoesterase [unclassified Anaeromyxobacter]|uniref:metallophosphoesterase n=2 Tax=Anaeromyxobacter TaxID=161492 RepID=UPI001F58F91D|nr:MULTISPECIES: metallophosphoesterase [unclassified Anaeromyxobacter]